VITPWVGNLNVVFIAAAVDDDPLYEAWPENWRELVEQRIFYDPDPVTGIDRSLRTYITSISSGKATFDADIEGLVHVDGCGAGPPIEAVSTSHEYDVACVVFPEGQHDCGGMAILRTETPYQYFDPPREDNKLLGWCRFRIDDSLGTWAMEFLHSATGFDDLYKTDPHPRGFDEMACNCGTHPSSFTKHKLGWLPDSSMANVRPALQFGPRSFALHSVGLPQPPPAGRFAGLRIYSGLFQSQKYHLVEARLRTDPYETGVTGLSRGIPSEGVVIYEVDESVWAPMKLRTNVALRAGETFDIGEDGLSVTVSEALTAGYAVSVHKVERREEPWLIPVLHQMN
jgi:hypothetical protein